MEYVQAIFLGFVFGIIGIPLTYILYHVIKSNYRKLKYKKQKRETGK